MIQIQCLFYQYNMNAQEIKKYYKRKYTLNFIKKAIAMSEMSVDTEKYLIIPSKMNY